MLLKSLLVALLGAALIPPSLYAPYEHPQRLVDIGGRKLNLYCSGTGSPTVVLDTDTDDSTVAWRLVQPAVAKHARVCSYDSAGLGFSDPAPGPRDANAYVRDLHTLLHNAHVPGPYALVGYSLSGLFTRLYADRYPRDVAGMVLVDPYFVGRDKRIASVAPPLEPFADEAGFIASLESCKRAAARHGLGSGTQAFQMCMWPTGPTDPALPQAVQRTLQDQWRRPSSWQDLILTEESLAADDREITQAQRSYGDLPLIVLTSDVRVDVKGLPLTAAQLDRLARLYHSEHEQIAALSKRGTNVVVAGSNEAIAEQRPGAVIAAINNVLAQARNTR